MKKRLFILGICFCVALLALVVKLTYIQIIDVDKYASAAGRLQRITLDGADERGIIYDRNMNPLTGTLEEYVYIIGKDQLDEKALKVFQNMGAKRVKNTSKNYYVYRSPVYNAEATYILKKEFNVFAIRSAKRYDEVQPAVHLIGYINKSDGNGATGIEKAFNDILSKRQKATYAAADGKRMIIPGYGIHSTVENDGCGVITTLDIEIQKKAEDVLVQSGHKGAIIVTDARSGEVLASASAPSFNPYNVEDYLSSNNEEFINQALQGQYPPGSIFKIIIAAAALEKGVITKESMLTCKGYEEVNGVVIKCSTGGEEGHGDISFEEAFAKSCNSAFIQVGMLTGGEDILKMAEALGLGQRTLSHLSEEKKGLLPGLGDIQGAGIGNLSIGQGKLLVTPMQVNKMTSIIASEGEDKGLSLIKALRDEGKVIPLEKEATQRALSRQNAAYIKEMMVDTVTRGTANNLSLSPDLQVAGKTGSAEAAYYGEEVVHGWFTGFLPAEDPLYVITVFVESGGSGRQSAVPLFKRMVESLYRQE